MGPAALLLLLLPPSLLLLLLLDGGQIALISTGRSSPGLAMATLTAATAKQQGSKHASSRNYRNCSVAVQ
jgi:hypothetical protein